MDPLRAFADAPVENRGSSQGIPKLERESLDDFEHITREISPINDPNLQFINFERGPTGAKDVTSFDEKGSSELAGKTFPEQLASDIPTGASTILDNDSTGSSKNFMQYDKAGLADPAVKTDVFEDLNKSKDNILIETLEKDNESDISQADDDSIVESLKAKDLDDFKDVNSSPEPGKQPEHVVRLPTPEPLVKLLEPEPTKPLSPEPVLEATGQPIPEKDNSPTFQKITNDPLARESSNEPTPPREILKESTPPPKVPEHASNIDEEGVAPPVPVPRDYPEIGVLEPKEILCAFGLYTWFHPERLNPKVEALIYWRDVNKSAVVFASVLVVLLSLTLFSLISVVAYTSLTVLVGATSFRIYKSVLQAVQKTSEGHPFNTYILPVLENPTVTALFQTIEEYLDLDLTLSPERVREVSDVAVSQLNTALSELRRRFLVEDLVDSLKFGVFLYVLTYVGAWFNGLTLIILAFVALFTLPKIYEGNQAQIDANLEQVRARINDVTDKIRAVIPIGKKSDGDQKDKEE